MSQQQRTILIVDDSPLDREFFQRCLLKDQDYSYSILEANFGKEGLELWQQHQPDVVLLDYRLPDMEGLEFLASLCPQSQQIYFPVIVVTGQGSEVIAAQMMKAGAQDYLLKGEITSERLCMAINGVIAKVQLQNEVQLHFEKDRLISKITQKIHQLLNIAEILQTTVSEVRQFLKSDRVLIFHLQSDNWGIITTESVAPGWTPLLSTSYYDPCLNESYVNAFRQGFVTVKPDIHDGSIDPCHVQLLANLEVRANLVVPILQNDYLWGMLIVHQCQAPRKWQPIEINLLQELATHLGIALRQADLYQQAQHELEERRRAEQKIGEQAALIDVATDAIFVRDLENRILFWSRGAENLYGWIAEESIGKLAHELFHTESLSQLEEGLKTTVEQGFWQGELEQITKTGREIIVASRWTLIQNQFGQSQSILVVNTDITEKKQLEQQFYRAQRLESVGTLASGIAHDLNNVFAPIVMIAQLLPDRCKSVDAQTQELFKTLETSSKRGADLVKQILTFARGTEGQRILLQPGHLLKELVKVIKQTFPKSIDIRADIPTNTLWMVKADPTQIEQVFMNLAVNARDAMPNGGMLKITAENRMIDTTYARMHLDAHAGDYIVVTVSDTGTGIPPEFLERIFDPFFTTKEVGKGTGLGLSTVLGIVKNHEGFINVLSEVGKGTEFQAFLPRGEGTATEATIEAELPRGNGELILVVDDEAVVQKITQETLEDYNYKTLVANDGIEAITLYAQYQSEISLVLQDMFMPNMDGFTSIRTLKALNPQVKIIATSGLPANEQKAIAAGADKFLSKPYTTTDLLTTLSDVIGIKE